MAGPVAALEQPFARRAAAAGETVAAVLASELDAELFEPVDRRRSLRREDLDELAVRRFVGGLPDVLRMLLGRVVVAESRLYAPLRLRRVAGLQRTLRRHGDPDAGSSSGDRCSEAGRAAGDPEHIEGRARHDTRNLPHFV